VGTNARNWLRWGAAGVLIIAVLALAVGQLGKTTSSTFGPTAEAVQGAAAPGVAKRAVTAGGVGQPAPANVSGDSTDLPPLGDGIARAADISVEVKRGRFDAGWAEVFRLAQRYGGQILSSSRGSPLPVPVESTASSRTPASGEITMRVPADKFAAATNALRALGTVRADNASSEDVTQEYVDLQSRLRNSRAERDVLLSLFNRARTISDTLSIQRRLSDVEGEIEKITGRINYLDTRTAFSSITLHLGEPGAAFTPANETGPSFGQAWDTARAGLIRIAGASLILALWLTPFAVLALIGVTIWRRTRGPAPQV
jgi:hypothetical protein